MTIVIPGEPQGKARPRVVHNNGRSHSYTPEKTANYEALVKYAYRAAHGCYIAELPVAISIRAYYGIPKSASKRKREAMIGGAIRPTRKPDCDNIAKVVCDALNGIAYRDDAQIVRLTVEKWFAETPRVEVNIREIYIQEIY